MPQPKPVRYEHGWRVNFRDPKMPDGTADRYRRRFSEEEYGGDVEAYAAATQFIREALTGQESPLSDRPTLWSDIYDFLEYQKLDKRCKDTWVKALSQMLKVFAKHLEGRDVKCTRDVTATHLRIFRKDWLKGVKRSENTWEKYRGAISVFLNWCHERDPRVKNVAALAEFKRTVQQNPPETLERDEVQKILSFFDSRDQDRPIPVGTVFRILLYMGPRLGELMDLTWDDVSYQAETLCWGTKTKYKRTVPIPERLLSLLQALPQDDHYVLDDGQGGHLYHRKTYYRLLQEACAVMKIKMHTVHSLRHTCCRYLLEAGTELNLVSKILGHADIRTTMRYARHFNLDNARAAINKTDFEAAVDPPDNR